MLRDLYVSTVFLFLLLSGYVFGFSGIMAVANRLFGIDWILWEKICFSVRISGAVSFICFALIYMECSGIRSEIHAKGEQE